jgi:hypothetical protein
MKKKVSKKKSKPFSKYYFLVVAIILLVGSFIYIIFSTKTNIEVAGSSIEKRSEVFYPILYSDGHITENAIKTDPKFAEVYPYGREELLSNVISSVKKNGEENLSNELENGTWLWTSPWNITQEYRNQIINAAKINGIKNIYLSIDTYLDIFVMPEGKEKDEKKKQYDNLLREFIIEAQKNGITVDAEAGWRNWAEEGNTYKAFAILDYVTDFNEKYTEKFRGIQYDIEPYLLPEFKKNSAKVLTRFLGLAERIVSETVDKKMSLSFVIPEFYDGTFEKTSGFFYGWKYGHAVDHLLTILDKKPGSKIILMSYRNYSLGNDGSIDISKYEISKAEKSKTKIVIAHEAGDVEPDYVTFYGTSKQYYEDQVDLVEEAFRNEASFGGIAIHYINALMELN